MIHSQRDNPAPTSRDGIELWLDVLTSMLSLPSSQRDLVRDELEDHLRSRVDDLLIMGKSESEAIRTAIAELGETAQLARHISSANRTPKSFRRFAMNATFFVLAGSVLTASVSMMMPTSPHATIATQGEARIVTETEVSTPERHTFDIERGHPFEVLKEVANTFDLKLRVSDESFRPKPNQVFMGASMEFAGEYTREEAIEEIQSRVPMYFGDARLEVQGENLVLMTLEEYRRSQVEIRAYPIPSWAISSDDQYQFGLAIEQLLNTKHDLIYATIQPINGSLVVAASPEVHADLVDMAKQLKVLSQDMLEKNQSRLEEQRILKKRQIDRLQAKYEDAKRIFMDVQRKHGQLVGDSSGIQSERKRVVNSIEFGDDYQSQVDAVNAEYESKLAIVQAMINEHIYEVDEAKARFERLQQILIDAEAELILTSLEDPVLGT